MKSDYLGDTLLYVCNKWKQSWKTHETEGAVLWILPGKSQIILKMRTADVCHTVCEKLLKGTIITPYREF
jgi:hypothetical protein